MFPAEPNFFTTLAAAYVIGATPFGYLAGKWKGIDIRDHGSGNIGATNVIRVLGKGIGIPVFALDVLKGLLPVLCARWMNLGLACQIAAALGAVLGHNFTFWLGYKGGKGIATSAGALFGLMWLPTLVALIAWLLVFFLTRYVALGSIASAVALPIATAWQSGFGQLFAFSMILSLMAIWRHRSNLQRLRAGTENRFGKKSAPSEGGAS